MSKAKRSTPTEAILVMDSRLKMLSIRSQRVTGSWSKLFKVGEHYLDLSLKAQDTQSKARLLGKVVSPAGIGAGQVTLLGENGETQAEASLSLSGMFNLTVEQVGTYDLEMVIGQHQFVIRPIDVQ